MINSMQTAIIKKDLRSLLANKQLRVALILVPFIFTVVLPSIFVLTIQFAPDSMNDIKPLLDLLPIAQHSGTMKQTLTGIIFNYVIPVFFMIIPIMAASIMAASSFVGEKEKRTLETLLYSPLTLKQIFQSKIYASFVLSMLVSFGSFFFMMLVVQIELLLITGYPLIPNINWLITMLVLSPAISMMSITLIVRGSAKAKTMEEAQQKAIFLILPVILLVAGQFTGVILINAWMLLGLGIIFVLIDILLLKGSMRNFTYEKLLR